MSETVQIVEIGSLIQTKNDKSKQLQSSEYLQNGVLPIVDQGSQLICGYTNDLSKSYDKGLPVVIFGDHTLHTKFIDFNFAIGADGTQVVVPKSNDCDTKYLYYLILRASELIGSEGYKRHFKILKEFDIEYIKPIVEQQKIATILSSVDDVIEKTRNQIDKLKDLKTGLMQELLTQGIGHTEFKDSPVGRVPINWSIRSIGDLLEFKNGLNKEKKYFGHGNPIVNFTDVFHGYGIELNDLQGRVELTPSEHQRFEVKKGDVFFTRTSEVPHEIGMAAVFLENAENVSYSGFILRGRPITDELTIEFSKYGFSSDYVRSQIVSSCSYTTRALTNGSLLSKCIIAIPPKNEQLKIANVLDSSHEELGKCEMKLRALVITKKALMQDLLTGKVRVSLNDKEVAVA